MHLDLSFANLFGAHSLGRLVFMGSLDPRLSIMFLVRS
jgi:hypothetical protein